MCVASVPENITAKNGLLYVGDRQVGLPEADELARKYGYLYAERLVKFLEFKKEVSMKLSDYQKYIGKTALFRVRLAGVGLSFKVKILDVKHVYGKIRYLLEPVAGCGSAWVENGNLVID